MDQRQFIVSLSPDQRRRLHAKSDRRGLAHLAVHAGAMVALAGLILLRVPLWPILMLPLGILIIFLFTLLHESIHRTAFATTWLNDTVARWCGFLILLPSDWFRYFHFAHHRHTQDPEHDPELATPKPETIGQYAVYVSGIPVWFSHVKTLLRNALGRCDDAFVPRSGRARVTMEARVMLASYAAIAAVSVWAASPQLLYVWIVPILLGQPFLRLYLLAEHGRCPFVANMFENSRTTFTNRAMRRLAWNMPYHAEHHAIPTVPFHRLPELHEFARTHLRITEAGYSRFHQEYVRDIVTGTGDAGGGKP